MRRLFHNGGNMYKELAKSRGYVTGQFNTEPKWYPDAPQRLDCTIYTLSYCVKQYHYPECFDQVRVYE